MTSTHARNAEPRRCIGPRSADLNFWGGESMVSVAIKAARYVCGVFISFSLVDSCSVFPGVSGRFVILSAAAPRVLQLRCTTAEGRNVSDPTVFLAIKGLAVRALPCLSGERSGADSRDAYT